jgi:histidinol-phosphate phosphatase family protein
MPKPVLMTSMMKRRAVFLGRDGLINRHVYNQHGAAEPPSRPGDFEVMPGAAEAIAALNRLCIPAIVVSNQPGIAHGTLCDSDLDTMNEAMRVRLAWNNARLDAVLYCRHHPAALLPQHRSECVCRLPRPGLLIRAAHERNLNLSASFFIASDAPEVLAGRAVGATTILVSPHRSSPPEQFLPCGAVPHALVRDLHDAVSFVRDALGPFWLRPRRVLAFASRIGTRVS